MREVTPETAAEYLRETGHIPAGRKASVQALGWGVSNVVMRVDVEGEAPFVLKQARERLRTKALWMSRLDRIWTEKAAMELLTTLLPEGTVPRVLFAEEPDYLFAMTCAPDDSEVWKEQLLAGKTEQAVARRAGEILATVHARSIAHPALEGRLADTVVFDQLRIDPFYRSIARAHPALAGRVEALTASMASSPTRCLVLADFSPKNILVHSGGLTLVDFETAHAGDPAYDLGFFLSHLLLKAVRASPNEEPYLELFKTFWNAYLETAGDALDGNVVHRACGHAAACALARVDGTSPVDYLSEPSRKAVRRFADKALRAEPRSWNELLAIAACEVLQK
jgi:5-methylthioribose kinase